MSRTESAMVELGTAAPPFELPDVLSGRTLTRDDIAAAAPNGLLVMFLSVHCPFVKHVEHELANLARDYASRIAFCAIMSNDVAAFPDDSPENMRAQARRLGWPFPYLYDETQAVARAYSAACTPDLFLFAPDPTGSPILVYRGQLDDSRPRRSDGYGNDTPVTGRDLRAALDAVLAGQRPDPNQRPSIGCNIKWRES
jgi:peroxiredoxin